MKPKLELEIHLPKINRLIRYFVLADLVFFGAWGFIDPIFAIFIIKRVAGASLITVGVAAAMYWVVRALVQLPVAIFLDKSNREGVGFHLLIFSLIMAGFVAMAFMAVKTIFAFFVVQFLHAVAFGLYFPAWSGIFSRHLDKTYQAFDWSLDNAAVCLAFGFSGFIGAALANFFGFPAVFILVGILSLASALILFLVPDLILPKPKTDQMVIEDHKAKIK